MNNDAGIERGNKVLIYPRWLAAAASCLAHWPTVKLKCQKKSFKLIKKSSKKIKNLSIEKIQLKGIKIWRNELELDPIKLSPLKCSCEKIIK